MQMKNVGPTTNVYHYKLTPFVRHRNQQEEKQNRNNTVTYSIREPVVYNSITVCSTLITIH